MPTLEGVEVYPRCLTPPFSRGVATTWMISHQVILIYPLDGGSKSLPHFSLNISLNISANNPNNVWTVFVTIGQETTINLSLFYREFASLYHSTPDAHHTDVDATLLGLIDNVVHMVPVTIVGFGQQISLLVVRGLPIDVHRGHIVQHLYLSHVIAGIAYLI